MSKTDGIIINKINNIAIDKLYLIIFISIIIWVFFPIVAIIMNLLSVSPYTYHGILIMLLYLSGSIGLIFGGIFVYRIVRDNREHKSKLLQWLFPLALLFLLGIWSVICTLFAEEKRVAIYGYGSLRDNLLTFLFYGGFVLSGLVIAFDKRKFKKIVIILIIVSLLFSLFVLLIDDVNMISGTEISENKESVGIEDDMFYGEYFLLASIVSFALYLQLPSTTKCLLIPISLLFVVTIVLVGDYISCILYLLLTLILIIYSSKKKSMNSINAVIMLALSIAIIMLVLAIDSQISFNSINAILFDTFKDRVSRWKNALALIYNNSMVGVGPQNTMQTSRNYILQIGIYLGAPGIIIFISTIFITIRNALCDGKYKMRSLFTIMTICTFLLSMILLGTAYYLLPYLYILIGFLIGLTVKEENLTEY